MRRIWFLAALAACGGPATTSQSTISNQPAGPTPTVAMAAPAPDKMPNCAESDGVKCVVGQMEWFTKQMCNCKDKSCADGVNESMTKWGTELAKNYAGKRDEKPDPDMAKRSADIMTRYTECMTKSMMGGDAKPPPDPCAGGEDPCGG